MLNGGGVNLAFATVDKHMIEFVKQRGSKMLGVKVNDITHDVHILENNKGVLFNKFVDIFPALNNVHGFDVINKLTSPWVEVLLFVELKLTKPRRKHTASTHRFFNKALQPLNTSNTQLKVHRENTTFLQHLMVGHASVLALLVNFMSFSQQQRPTSTTNKSGELVILRGFETESLHGRNERIVDHRYENYFSHTPGYTGTSDETSEDNPISPRYGKPGFDFNPIGPIGRVPDTQILKLVTNTLGLTHNFFTFSLTLSGKVLVHRYRDFLFAYVLVHTYAVDMFIELRIIVVNELVYSVRIKSFYHNFREYVVSVH